MRFINNFTTFKFTSIHIYLKTKGKSFQRRRIEIPPPIIHFKGKGEVYSTLGCIKTPHRKTKYFTNVQLRIRIQTLNKRNNLSNRI